MQPIYQYVYDEQELRDYLEDYAHDNQMTEMERAIAYAWQMHEGQTRINGQPFIVHPLFVAKYGIQIGAKSEDRICMALLHDVCEDCDISPEELPFNKRVQDAVARLTYVYDFQDDDTDEDRQLKKIITKTQTFANLVAYPEELICKCIDRYHNLTTCEELPRANITKNVEETHRMLLPVVYSALKIRKYASYYSQLYVLMNNLCSLNNEIALKHKIILNPMS